MLAASSLTRRFGSRLAVDRASFELARGEILALLGPNGAGKTTTLRMLAGLIEPTSGEVRLDGQRVASGNAERLRARVGFLTEAPGLWDRLTVRDNLLVYARMHGLPDPQRAAAQAMDTVGVADRATDPAAVLSKGLKQRVALARTLMHNPQIVLLDEPTSGLDPESARGVRELILRLRDEDRAVLISTHNLDEVERLASRVAVLRQHLLAVDTPAALRAQLFGTRVRIVLKGSAMPYLAAMHDDGGGHSVSADDGTLTVATRNAREETPAIVRRLVELGADIVSVAADEPSLEDVYLRLVHQPETHS